MNAHQGINFLLCVLAGLVLMAILGVLARRMPPDPALHAAQGNPPCEGCAELVQELRYRLYQATGDGRPEESAAPLEFSKPVRRPRSIGDDETPLTTEKVLKRLENYTNNAIERDETR